jgi:hypothetical protein
VAVARKSKVEGELSQVDALAKPVERSSQPPLQLVAIERQSFDLPEQLREIDGGDADESRDVGEGPSTSEVGRKH